MTGVLSEIPDQVRDDGEERSVMQREYVLDGCERSVMRRRCVLGEDGRSTMWRECVFDGGEWTVLKDYLEYQGVTSIVGSRDATRLAFSNGLIDDGEVWMDMIQSRNLTSHTYDEELAEDISEKIIELYHPALLSFKQKMITRNIDS